MMVQIGGTVHDVKEDLVKEQVQKNFKGKGFIHALQFYRHLRPDDPYEDAKATVEAWCASLTEGSVSHVREPK
jgi:hypothetical protein